MVLAALALVTVVVTVRMAVPAHARLAAAPDPADVTLLLRANLARTLAWTAIDGAGRDAAGVSRATLSAVCCDDDAALDLPPAVIEMLARYRRMRAEQGVGWGEEAFPDMFRWARFSRLGPGLRRVRRLR